MTEKEKEEFKEASFEEIKIVLSEYDYMNRTKEDTINFLKYILHEIDKLEN